MQQLLEGIPSTTKQEARQEQEPPAQSTEATSGPVPPAMKLKELIDEGDRIEQQVEGDRIQRELEGDAIEASIPAMRLKELIDEGEEIEQEVEGDRIQRELDLARARAAVIRCSRR